ncbi:MAG TPA: IS5 family transposase [Dehalococcoidia bacterium]|nr:IS5 family transposase [Dehalococcoidia bacterium]
MRGDADQQAMMLTAITPDAKVPKDHPIRAIKPIVDRALLELSPVFNAMYAKVGRPSIPPEHLLKAQLLMAFFSVPSARRFCEQLEYNLLFKWFLDVNVDDPAFDASTFSKNQERLLQHDVAHQFLAAVTAEAARRQLLSSDHFTVDGTLLQAWASLKSVRPREDDDLSPPAAGGRNRDVDFRGQRRSNQTHVSATDAEARLARKGDGQETRLCFAGHVLMENRNGLVVDLLLTQATGRAEREAALRLLDRRRGRRRISVGADKAYDTTDFVAGCRALNVTPQVAQHTTRRRSRIDRRTTRHPGYAVAQRIRKRVEEIFGWVKTVGGGRKLRYLGVRRNEAWATIAGAAYNLVRMAHIELAPRAA